MDIFPQATEKRRILTLIEVCQITGFSKSTIYRLKREHKFPQTIKTGVRTNGWLREDVDQWIEMCKKTSEQEYLSN